FRPRPYIGETQNQTQQKAAEVCKEWSGRRLLWKYVFAVFQRLHKSAGAEITVASLQHFQGKSPVASAGGPYAVQGRQHRAANVSVCDFQIVRKSRLLCLVIKITPEGEDAHQGIG